MCSRELRIGMAALALLATAVSAVAQPAATLSGTVVDSTGTAVSGVSVTVRPRAGQVAHAISDAEGKFVATGLSTGEVRGCWCALSR